MEWSRTSALVLVGALTGCSPSEKGQSSPLCLEGTEVECTCEDGSIGTRICMEELCMCGGSTDTGTATDTGTTTDNGTTTVSTTAADSSTTSTTDTGTSEESSSTGGPACGNGMLDEGEDCDDGNDVDADGCNNDCSASGSWLWTQTYDGPSSIDDGFEGVALDAAERPVVAGFSNDVLGDLFVRAYDADGAVSWTNVSNPGVARGIARRPDGGFAIAGMFHTDMQPDFSFDIWIGHVDEVGGDVWGSSYAGAEGFDDEGNAVATDSMNATVVVGRTSDGMFVGKYASDGSEAWASPAGQPDSDAYGVVIDADNSIIVVGHDSGVPGDVWLRRYASDGSEIWTQTVGTAADESGRAVALDVDGNIVVAGFVEGDVLVMKLDPDGGPLWDIAWDGGQVNDWGYAVAVDSADSIVVVGVTQPQTHDILVLKLDPDGVELWSTSYDGPESYTDRGLGVAVDSLGSIYVAGQTRLAAEGWNGFLGKLTP